MIFDSHFLPLAMMMRRMCHCEVHNQRYSSRDCKKCAGHCCIWPCGWFRLLWHYSTTAKYFTQIWPRLLIAVFYPPKQNKQILSPPISMFCCCHCFIRCLALLCDKCKMKPKLKLSSYFIQANFECTCALTSYNVANRSTSS